MISENSLLTNLHENITLSFNHIFDTILTDAVKVFDFVVLSTNYDPITGNQVETSRVRSIRGIVDSVGSFHVDGEVVKVHDTLFIVLQEELTLAPKVDDYIDYAGDMYRINRIISDPVDIHWDIFARTI